MTFQMPQGLIDLLADPETHEPVRLANETQLTALRAAIASGAARRQDGAAPPQTFDAAFLSRGGKRAYLVVDGIPNFLLDESVELSESLR